MPEFIPVHTPHDLDAARRCGDVWTDVYRGRIYFM